MSLLASDNPVIETIHVAPRLDSSSIVLQTVVRNYGPSVSFRLRHGVRTWKGEAFAAEAAPQQLQLAAGESKTIEQTIRIPDARLWSPEDPFL